MSKKGVKDLMDEQRYSVKHIQQAMLDQKVPGNWLSTQNVYNLVNGKTIPRDGYVYLFLSDFFNEDPRKILTRYTTKNVRFAELDKDLF